jgi:hypothetical protein
MLGASSCFVLLASSTGSIGSKLNSMRTDETRCWAVIRLTSHGREIQVEAEANPVTAASAFRGLSVQPLFTLEHRWERANPHHRQKCPLQPIRPRLPSLSFNIPKGTRK